MATTTAPTSVRLPPSVRVAIQERAQVERRSFSQQLVHTLEVGLAASPPPLRLFRPAEERDG